MSSKSYKVSIGLPVYNGENFVSEAIESWLAQTFDDFELAISDNGSSDKTEFICRDYANRDKRVRYYRNPTNRGSSWNYTRVFQLTSGEYFKWTSHDDLYHPDFLSRCVDLLDQDPSVVLSFARTRTIDVQGRFGRMWPSRPGLAAARPYERYRDVLTHGETFAVWGLMRRAVLAKTRLLGDYPAHDLPLLSELSLHGKFHEISEYLFFEREHSKRSVRAYDYRKPHDAIVWYNPAKAGKLIFPRWRLLAEYLSAIRRSPIDWRERALCYAETLRWARRRRGDLWRDLEIAGSRLPITGRAWQSTFDRYAQARWANRTRRVAKAIGSAVPPGETLVIADQAQLDRTYFARWHTHYYPDKNGEYSGAPEHSNIAIRELERLRRSGARFIVFAWPAFWWLDHYGGLRGHLNLHCRKVLETRDAIIFNLNQEREAGHE